MVTIILPIIFLIIMLIFLVLFLVIGKKKEKTLKTIDKNGKIKYDNKDKNNISSNNVNCFSNSSNLS